MVVLPAADADQVPQNSIAACAVEIRPVEFVRNMTLCGTVDRVPDATTDIRSSPLTCNVSPVGPTACDTISACSVHTHVVAAVGASVGHGVARVVPSVPTVGSQPRTKLNVAAHVVAMLPDAHSPSAPPMRFGLPPKKFAGTIATACVAGALNTACVV